MISCHEVAAHAVVRVTIVHPDGSVRQVLEMCANWPTLLEVRTTFTDLHETPEVGERDT